MLIRYQKKNLLYKKKYLQVLLLIQIWDEDVVSSLKVLFEEFVANKEGVEFVINESITRSLTKVVNWWTIFLDEDDVFGDKKDEFDAYELKLTFEPW